MSLYIDNFSAIDTEYIACVHPFEGHGPQDGVYGLAYMLVSGDRLKRVWIDYPDKATRDTAFQTLAALMGQEMAEEGEGMEL